MVRIMHLIPNLERNEVFSYEERALIAELVPCRTGPSLSDLECCAMF